MYVSTNVLRMHQNHSKNYDVKIKILLGEHTSRSPSYRFSYSAANSQPPTPYTYTFLCHYHAGPVASSVCGWAVNIINVHCSQYTSSSAAPWWASTTRLGGFDRTPQTPWLYGPVDMEGPNAKTYNSSSVARREVPN